MPFAKGLIPRRCTVGSCGRGRQSRNTKSPEDPRTQEACRDFGDTLPNANGLCTSANGTDVNRIPTAVVLAADVIWFVADGLREGLQDACKETLVVVGEGAIRVLHVYPWMSSGS